MFGKSKLKKIIAMLNGLSDEELDELISVAEDAKDGDEEVEEKTEEVEKTEEITGTDEGAEEIETEVDEETETEVETETADEAEADEVEETEEEAEESAEVHQEVDGEILSSIKAMKETIEALTARIEAMEKSESDERHDFEFGLEGKDEVTEESRDSLEEIKKKYWNI